MKRYTGLVLAVALTLSACGGASNVAEKTSAPESEVLEVTESVNLNVETTEAVSDEKETVVVEDESQPGVELPDHEIVHYTPLDIGLDAEYEGEWDDNGPIMTADCSKILILDDGYEELKKAVDEYNERNWQEVYTLYTEHLEYVKEEIFPERTELSISREVKLTRADSKVLSFINAETSYLGGAHGSYYENGEVFDAETGEVLELTDVVTDLDAVYKYVNNYLKDNYEKEAFFEGYEKDLENMFYKTDEALASSLEWVLTMEGLEFRFSPYVLGPWVAGTFEVKLPYAGNEELFGNEYLCAVEHPIRKIAPNEEFYLDSDGDGIEDKIWFTETWDEETYSTTVTVNREGERADNSGFSSAINMDGIYGSFADAYLMYSEEDVPYLYLEILMDNDWRKLHIIRLAESEDFHSMKVVGSAGTAVYGHFMSDPNHFALYDRLDILGTYYAYKNYAVGPDGMPVSDEELYDIAIPYFHWDHTLTAQREIPVLMHQKGSGEKVEEILPEGTRFRPRKTDGETMVEMEMEDGRRCTILVERKEGEYVYYIDGVSEYDCFGDVPYAG